MGKLEGVGRGKEGKGAAVATGEGVNTRTIQMLHGTVVDRSSHSHAMPCNDAMIRSLEVTPPPASATVLQCRMKQHIGGQMYRSESVISILCSFFHCTVHKLAKNVRYRGIIIVHIARLARR